MYAYACRRMHISYKMKGSKLSKKREKKICMAINKLYVVDSNANKKKCAKENMIECDSNSQSLNIENQIARRFICYFEMRNVHQLETNDVYEFVYFL